MTRTRKAGKREQNENPFKGMVGMRSHNFHGSTRSNRGMKNANNLGAWHNQIQNVLKQQQRESELLGISGRAHAAFHGENKSTLPAHASKAQRNAATYQRLMGELDSLEGRGHLSNANKNRRNTLRKAVKEYAPNLQLGGGITVGEFSKVVRKYFPHISEHNIQEKYLPKYVSSPAEMVDKSEGVRSLIRKVMDKIEKGPETEETKKDMEVMRAAMKWINPTGLPAGYRGGAKRVAFEMNGPRMKDLMPVLERRAGLSKERLRQILAPVPNPTFSKINAMRRIIFNALKNLEIKLKEEPDSQELKKDEKILRSAAKYAIPTGVIGYGNLPNMNATSPLKSRTLNRNREPDANLYAFPRGGGTRRRQRGGACPCSAGLPPNPLGL